MLNIETEKLLAFENQLNPLSPEGGEIPAEVLGYGEISAILKISGMPDIAFKRLPPFANNAQRDDYQQGVIRYCHELKNRFDIDVVEFEFCPLNNVKGESILYMAQPCLDGDGFGNAQVAALSGSDLMECISPVIDTYLHIAKIQGEKDGFKLGIDGQISNWHFRPLAQKPRYVDISTPFLRQNGKEVMDPELFLQAVPKLLSGLVKKLFLQEVLDRYYDMRAVLIDLLANLHKEQQAEKIDLLVLLINQKISEQGVNIKPITRKEVDDYYKSDARIWRLFLALRRLDRFVTTKFLRRTYNFILPGAIQR